MTLTIKQEYFKMIGNGKKQLEIGVGNPNILSIRAGNQILLISGRDRQVVTVKSVRRYDSFDQMLSREDTGRVIPGLSRSETLGVLQRIYPQEKESLGVVAIEVCPIKSTEAIT